MKTILVLLLTALAPVAMAQPPGQILFVSSRAGQFNKIWRMNANGSAQTQLSFGVGYETDPSWSPDGEHIVYVSNPSPGAPEGHIAVMDRHGTGRRNLTAAAGLYRHPRYSPDGTQILFSRQVADNESELFVIAAPTGAATADEARHVPMPLEVQSGDVVSFDDPTWAPDGHTIAFWVWRLSELGTPNYGNVYRAGLDGQNLQRLTDGLGRNSEPAWSPDGQQIAFYGARPEGTGLFVINANGGPPRLLSVARGMERRPSWSHDGRWLTFVSTRNGNQDVFVMRLDDGSTEAVNLTAASTAADHSPAWSPASVVSVHTAIRATSWARAKRMQEPAR